jgi:choline dehydrogenase-like flavoprotein
MEPNPTTLRELNINEAADQHWDAIIVGTGMGGSTLGFALAKAGKRVLFCEAGRALLRPDDGLRGDYAETFFEQPCAPTKKHREILLQAGRRAEELQDVSGPYPSRHIPFIGGGAGGSSALYGAALERFFPQDFSPRQNHPDATSASLPEHWPVAYEEMVPYYQQAESLYRVRGSADPLGAAPQPTYPPPPPLCSATQELEQRLAGKGLHTYRVPQACEFVPGCEGCQGFLCQKECKNDAARICLRPALDNHGAQLLGDCEVISLEATRDAVTGVVCRQRGKDKVSLTGDLVILAAGALETPRILLSSATDDWPDGLANDSGLVGRNLMRHCVDMYAVPAGRNKEIPGNRKEIAFNDFYIADGQKFGTVQSFGALPPAAIIVEEMQWQLENSRQRWLAPLFRIGKPVLRQIVSTLLARRMVFASIMEDLPYLDNRVQLSASPSSGGRKGLELRYHVPPEDQRRIQLFRRKVQDAFRPSRVMLLQQAENNTRIAHACGTCRFGDNPADSVLDRTNRAHGLENLYVVDASFFPSSGGTNPALTIAANALRVADILLGTAMDKSNA